MSKTGPPELPSLIAASTCKMSKLLGVFHAPWMSPLGYNCPSMRETMPSVMVTLFPPIGKPTTRTCAPRGGIPFDVLIVGQNLLLRQKPSLAVVSHARSTSCAMSTTLAGTGRGASSRVRYKELAEATQCAFVSTRLAATSTTMPEQRARCWRPISHGLEKSRSTATMSTCTTLAHGSSALLVPGRQLRSNCSKVVPPSESAASDGLCAAPFVVGP
mmetsp:Transcript_11194/g.29831  ORF Transcript_11194/g.29831 Transcript_11194/m.29831 type:complete len:216 (+) Transcript_11194:233-880(+)